MRFLSSLLFLTKKQLLSFVFYSLCLLGTIPLIGQTSYTSFPSYQQLYQRDIPNNYATVPVDGIIAQYEGYTKLRLKVYRESSVQFDQSRNLNFSGGRASFSFSVRINAELANYRFELYGERNGTEILLKNANDVVAGDIILINGQSNALAFAAAKPADFDNFARTYESGWKLMQHSFPGQWGAHLAKTIIQQKRIPVAIFNQAEGGQSIDYFLRNDRTPSAGNYGKLKKRLEDGRVDNRIASVIWFQGEGDGWGTTISEYKSDFTKIYQAWKQDYNPKRTYIFQIRFGSCSHVKPYPMEAQRQLAEEFSDIGIMSTNNVDHDGCHYPFERGYKLLAQRIYGLVNRDIYGVNSSNVEAPSISKATLYSSRELRLEFDNTSSLETSGSPWSDFTLEGSSARVTSGRVVGNEVRLTLSTAVSSLDGVTYLAHIGSARNWVYNSNDVGILSFYDFPVSQGTTSTPTPTPTPTTPTTPTPTNCGEVTVGIGASSITLSGLSAPVVTVQVFNPDWSSAFSCNGDCTGTTKTVSNLSEGRYFVRIQLLSASWQLICKVEDYYTVDGSGSSTPPAEPPSSGSSCDNINISASSNSVTIRGLDQVPIRSLLVLSEDWSTSYYNCWGDACENGTITVPVGQGSYRVIAKHYTPSYQEECVKELILAVGNLTEDTGRRNRIASNTTQKELKIFPTIVKDQLQVQLPQATNYIKIFSQQGQLIQTVSVKNWEVKQSISLDSTAQGMYFLNASFVDGTNKTSKFFIR